MIRRIAQTIKLKIKMQRPIREVNLLSITPCKTTLLNHS